MTEAARRGAPITGSVGRATKRSSAGCTSRPSAIGVRERFNQAARPCAADLPMAIEPMKIA
jgi:hypothetical protein